MTQPRRTRVTSAFLRNVIIIVGEGAADLDLLAGEHGVLLVRRNTLFIPYLCLDVVDGVWRLSLEHDRLASQHLDKDLCTSTKTQDCEK